jgi:hypothetical protein
MATAKNEKLNDEVFEMTTGLLLGDGNLQKPKQCNYFRFRFAQNEKRQDYVNWVLKNYKKGLVNPISKKPLVVRETPHVYEYLTSKNKNPAKSFRFQTRISSAFDKDAEVFYANNSTKKNLWNDLSCFDKYLTPRALAYWYMDDGTWTSKTSYSFLLCTHGFRFEDVVYLSNLLNKKFELITKVRLNRKQPVIAISTKCYPIFKSLISLYIDKIPSMESKFPKDLEKLEDIV